ncbi:MAG: GAF domain-containing sensor histidine kinase [Oligoflexales bacterium]|nr:GAF domain-containing sensor histidine kinase [Oligoflexales bacterium]
MTTLPLPVNEEQRLRSLYDLFILDTDIETEYQHLVELTANILETPICLISLIDQNRQWCKAKLGVEIEETPREISFCTHTILKNEPMIINDLNKDNRFAQNPFVVNEPNVKFYAGVPIKYEKDLNLGTLCVLDVKERQPSERQIDGLKILAEAVSSNLKLRFEHFQNLKKEEELQFNFSRVQELLQENRDLTSMLIHDFKNPLSVITSACNMIIDKNKKPEKYIEKISSSAGRIGQMIESFLDTEDDELLSDQLNLVRVSVKRFLEKLRQSLNSEESLPIELGKIQLEDVVLDEGLISRVLENLISNANKYASDSEKIYIECLDEPQKNSVVFNVKDQGPGIPNNLKQKVFKKNFKSGVAQKPQTSSQGLGLAFCQKVVEAHKGLIWIEDHYPKGSSLCFRIQKDLDLSEKEVLSEKAG